jgi:hypothetical protein
MKGEKRSMPFARIVKSSFVSQRRKKEVIEMNSMEIFVWTFVPGGIHIL